MKGQFIQERVQEAAIVNEPEPTRAPWLRFHNQRHDQPWLVSGRMPSAYVLGPRGDRAHGDELANSFPCPVLVLGLDAVLAGVVSVGPHAAAEGHLEAVAAHTVEERVVRVCAPNCVRLGRAQARGQSLGHLPRRRAQVNDAAVGVGVQFLEAAEPVEVVVAVVLRWRSLWARWRGRRGWWRCCSYVLRMDVRYLSGSVDDVSEWGGACG